MSTNLTRKAQDTLFKLVLFVIMTVLCFLPFEIWFALYKFADPVGFWQKFAIVGIGVWVFGAFQVFGFILWLVGSFKLWFED